MAGATRLSRKEEREVGTDQQCERGDSVQVAQTVTIARELVSLCGVLGEIAPCGWVGSSRRGAVMVFQGVQG